MIINKYIRAVGAPKKPPSCGPCPLIIAQKRSFKPSWITRGANAAVDRPNVALPRFPSGLKRFTRLKRLKASARNWIVSRSRTFVPLDSPRSTSLKAGPRNAFRLRFPFVPTGKQGVPKKNGTRPLGQKSVTLKIPFLSCWLLKPVVLTFAGRFERSLVSSCLYVRDDTYYNVMTGKVRCTSNGTRRRTAKISTSTALPLDWRRRCS